MTAALEVPGSFLEAFRKFMEKNEKNKFMKVRCVEHGERVCATVALEDPWEDFQAISEAFPSRKLSGSYTVPEGRWPTQRLGVCDLAGC